MQIELLSPRIPILEVSSVNRVFSIGMKILAITTLASASLAGLLITPLLFPLGVALSIALIALSTLQFHATLTDEEAHFLARDLLLNPRNISLQYVRISPAAALALRNALSYLENPPTLYFEKDPSLDDKRMHLWHLTKNPTYLLPLRHITELTVDSPLVYRKTLELLPHCHSLAYIDMSKLAD